MEANWLELTVGKVVSFPLAGAIFNDKLKSRTLVHPSAFADVPGSGPQQTSLRKVLNPTDTGEEATIECCGAGKKIAGHHISFAKRFAVGHPMTMPTWSRAACSTHGMSRGFSRKQARWTRKRAAP